jgi:hypothetical protein
VPRGDFILSEKKVKLVRVNDDSGRERGERKVGGLVRMDGASEA